MHRLKNGKAWLQQIISFTLVRLIISKIIFKENNI